MGESFVDFLSTPEASAKGEHGLSPASVKRYSTVFSSIITAAWKHKFIETNPIGKNYIHYPKRIYPIGRLDKNSQGLILLTNDGSLVNHILKASNYHEKEYVVTVDKPVTEEFLKKMSSGVEILEQITRPCKVTKVSRHVFNIVLTQGLNRQIRRLCDALGYHVQKLQRIRVMNIKLGNLKKGSYRQLTDEELKSLRKS